jgi:hypothetical protein
LRRLRLPYPALSRIALALAVTTASLPAPAMAQANVTNLLMRPEVDGDPLQPPRFRKPTDSKENIERGRAASPSRGGTTTFSPLPRSGAGTTGFDSQNLSKAGKAEAARIEDERVQRTQAVPNPAVARKKPAPVKRPGQPPVVTGTAEKPVTVPLRRKKPTVEEDPYAPLGIHAGGFMLRPAIEVSAGHDSNPARDASRQGSAFYVVAPEFLAQSLWSRHELIANVRGSYTAYSATPSFDRPNLDAKINGRIDVSRDTRIDLEGRYLLSADSPNDPDLPGSVSKLPLNNAYGATAGLARRFNRFELAAKGTVDRFTYQDATLNNGGIVSNKDRNYDQYGATLRGSYELTPGVRPFVEIGADTRVHDLSIDQAGVRRDSDGKTAKVGTTFELTRKLTGEVSAGYLTRNYEDPTLRELRGFIADASLVWSPTALTNVKLAAASTADESTLSGVSGVLKRDAGIAVEHAFRRNLIGTAKLGYGVDDFDGIGREDKRMVASAGLVYKLSRTTQVKGEFRQEWLRSNAPGNDYTASIVLVGLRWQR